MNTLNQLKAIISNATTELSGVELGNIYNELAEVPVVKFQNKATAIDRIVKLVEKLIDDLSTENIVEIYKRTRPQMSKLLVKLFSWKKSDSYEFRIAQIEARKEIINQHFENSFITKAANIRLLNRINVLLKNQKVA